MPVRLLKSVLESLNPSNEEELDLLRDILACAQFVQQQSSLDFGIGEMSQLSSQTATPTGVMHIRELMSGIPDHLSRYFYGLVEALEVYHSIHGRGIPATTVSMRAPELEELRRIRELCLTDLPHSAY